MGKLHRKLVIQGIYLYRWKKTGNNRSISIPVFSRSYFSIILKVDLIPSSGRPQETLLWLNQTPNPLCIPLQTRLACLALGKCLFVPQNLYNTLIGTTFNKVCKNGVECPAHLACSVNGALLPKAVYKKFSGECWLYKEDKVVGLYIIMIKCKMLKQPLGCQRKGKSPWVSWCGQTTHPRGGGSGYHPSPFVWYQEHIIKLWHLNNRPMVQ